MNLNSKTNSGELLHPTSLYTPDNDEKQNYQVQNAFDEEKPSKQGTGYHGGTAGGVQGIFTGSAHKPSDNAYADISGVRAILGNMSPNAGKANQGFTGTGAGVMAPMPIQVPEPQNQYKDAFDAVLGGSFGEDLKQRFAARRQESRKQSEKAYRDAVSVIGGNPEFASYRAMEADDAMKDIEKTIAETDIQELVRRISPLAKIDGYNLEEYLNEKVLPRMYDTLLDEVVEDEKPKSSAEYILRSSLTNSLIGKVALLGRDKILGNSNHTMLQSEGLGRYDANRFERFASSVGSLLVDAPVFSALGGGSSILMGQAAKKITSNLAGRILARKFGEGMTRETAKNVAARVVTDRLSFKMLQSAGTQGLTLGNYDAMNSIVDDLLYQNDVDTGKAAGSFAKGMLTGTALGVVGTPLREASKGLTGAKKLFASSGVLSAESAVFTAGTELEKLKNDIEVAPIDILQDFGESAATLLVMRMTHWRPKGASLKLGADGKLKEKFALSSSERAELKELNVNPEQFIEAVEKELRLPSFGGERSRYIKDTYSSIMANEKLSASVKSKLLFLVENKVTSTPPIPFDFTVKQREDGKWEITTVDEVGRAVSRNIFDHAGNAKSHLMVHAAELRRNRIALFEMELTNGVRSANFIRQAGLYAKSNGKNIEEVATAVYKKSAGLEMTPGEQKIVDDILERSAYDEAGMVQMLYNVRRKIEKRHGLEKGTMFIDIHEPFYRLSNAKNNSLNEYEALLRDEVDRLKGGTDRRRSKRLLKQGLDSDYFGMSNEEVKAKEIQDHYDWVAVRDADRIGLHQLSHPAAPPHPIYIPPEDNSGYVWSYGEAKNTREDIERYKERAEAIAAKFGVKPRFISDEREIERPDPEDYEAVVRYNTQIVSSGWVNMGRVFINLPNARNVEDVERAVLHEVVGHKGLMHVFGERLNDFLEDVYRKASPDVLRGINRIKHQYRDFDNYTVMEEYLAYLAEGTKLTTQERSLYVRIKDYIRSLLIRMNIYTGSNRQISESELRDIMQRHCEYLQTKADPQGYRKELFGSFKASHKDAKTYYSNAEYKKEMKSLIDEGRLLSSTPKFFRDSKKLINYELLPPEQQKMVRERNGIVEEDAQNPAEENLYRRGGKTTSGERSGVIPGNSSSGGLLQGSSGHLSRYSLATHEDVAKLISNNEITKSSVRKKVNQGGFVDLKTTEDAVRKIGEGLKLVKSKSSQSYYGDLYEGDFMVDGKTLHLRISTHPATGDRMGNHPADDKISIVVYKNGGHVSKGEHNGYTEYIYDPSKVSLNDAANSILNGVVSLIENGTFVDYTGRAEKKEYPYYKDGKLHYRLPDDRKTTSGERSSAVPGNSSSGDLFLESSAHLSRYPLAQPKHIPNIDEKTARIKYSAQKYLNKGEYDGGSRVQDVVRSLGKILKFDRSKTSQSYYSDLYINGRKVLIRISTHPATNTRMGNSSADDKISLVVYASGEHRDKGMHNGYTEYIYDPGKVSLNDAANSILNGVVSLIENGTFVDYTGRAEKKEYPYYEDGKLHYRLPGDRKTTSGERSGAVPGNSSSGGLHHEGNEHLSRNALTLQDDYANLLRETPDSKYNVLKRVDESGEYDVFGNYGEMVRYPMSDDLYRGEEKTSLSERGGADSGNPSSKGLLQESSEHLSRRALAQPVDYTKLIDNSEIKNLRNDAFVTNSAQKPASLEDMTKLLYEITDSKQEPLIHVNEDSGQLPAYYSNSDTKYRLPDDFAGKETRYRLPDDIYKVRDKEERNSLEREALARGTAFDPTVEIPLLEDPFFRSLKATSPTYAYVYEHLRGLPLEKWKAYDHDLWNTLLGMAEVGVEKFVLKDIVTDKNFLKEHPEVAMVPVGIEKNLPMPVMYDKENNRILLDRRVYLYPQSRFYINGALESAAREFEKRRDSVKRQLDKFNSSFKKNYNDAVSYARGLIRTREVLPGFDADNSIAEAFREDYGFMPDEFLTRFPDIDDYLLYRVSRSIGRFMGGSGNTERSKEIDKVVDSKIRKYRSFLWGPVEIIIDAADAGDVEGPLRVATKKDYEGRKVPQSGIDEAENKAYFRYEFPKLLHDISLFDPAIESDPTGWEEYKRNRDARLKAEKARLGIFEPKTEEEKQRDYERERRRLEKN